MFNCTVSENIGACGIENWASWFPSGTHSVYVDHCTVVFNTTTSGTAGPPAGFAAGASFIPRTAYLQATRTNDFSGVLTSEGYNLIQNTNGCTIVGDQTGNIYGADPLLGPLQDNGGPTWTHALLAGSPAIDAGPTNTSPSVDQRGMLRPQGPAEDIGAFECQSGVPIVQAVERLMAQVESRWPRSRPLIATLSAALHSIERGNFVSAVNQLLAFQNKVRAQVAPSDPALAASFIAAAQGSLMPCAAERLTQAAGRMGGSRLWLAIPMDGCRCNGRLAPGPAYILEASTNLVDWERIGVAVDRGDGMFSFEDANATRFPKRFYRIVSP